MAGNEHEIAFGTAHFNGQELQVKNIRIIKQSDIVACPQFIMVPSHYRPDGSCKCDDADERAVMIREWEYSPNDFNGPTRVTDCHELGTGYHEGATCGSRGIRSPFMCSPCQREKAK